ncbi:MAG: hypothetical protein K8R90_00930 [Candidatus Cloacimonetes bacterium]|nr:hypothetical protein [Candidatus Cloacimonadota bacterium]
MKLAKNKTTFHNVVIVNRLYYSIYQVIVNYINQNGLLVNTNTRNSHRRCIDAFITDITCSMPNENRIGMIQVKINDLKRDRGKADYKDGSFTDQNTEKRINNAKTVMTFFKEKSFI